MSRLKMNAEILKSTVAALVAGGLLLAAEQASALPIMTLSDGTTTVTVADNDGLFDKLGAVGAITFSGTIGNFSLNVTTGVTKPALGSVAWPSMDLNDISVTSIGGGTLTITFSDDGFTGPVALVSNVGGVTGGTARFEVWLDPGNTLLAKTTKIADLGSFEGAFSGTTSGAFTTGTGPYAITQVAILTHAARTEIKSSSFNLQTEAVPEPAAFGLLGVGLAGLGFIARRR